MTSLVPAGLLLFLLTELEEDNPNEFFKFLMAVLPEGVEEVIYKTFFFELGGLLFLLPLGCLNSSWIFEDFVEGFGTVDVVVKVWLGPPPIKISSLLLVGVLVGGVLPSFVSDNFPNSAVLLKSISSTWGYFLETWMNLSGESWVSSSCILKFLVRSTGV